MTSNLPNLLTFARIAAVPPLVVLFLIEGDGWRWATVGLFAAAALTDYFDGWVARSRGLGSHLGRFLDPVADKLLVAAVLFMLVASGRIDGLATLPALVILLREILISALREYMAGRRVDVPVSRLAKWKTLVQMLAIGFLIVGEAGPAALPVVAIGIAGLSVAAALAVVTAFDYVRGARRALVGPVPPAGAGTSDDGTRPARRIG